MDSKLAAVLLAAMYISAAAGMLCFILLKCATLMFAESSDKLSFCDCMVPKCLRTSFNVYYDMVSFTVGVSVLVFTVW